MGIIKKGYKFESKLVSFTKGHTFKNHNFWPKLVTFRFKLVTFTKGHKFKLVTFPKGHKFGKITTLGKGHNFSANPTRMFSCMFSRESHMFSRKSPESRMFSHETGVFSRETCVLSRELRMREFM